jgi:hypothetical protein
VSGVLAELGWTWIRLDKGHSLHLAPPSIKALSRTWCGRPAQGAQEVVDPELRVKCGLCLRGEAK